MTMPDAPPSSVRQTPPAPMRWTWIDVVLLVAVLLVALGLRMRHVDATPSFDELWHLRLSAAKGLPLTIFEPGRLYLDPTDAASIVDAPPKWKVWTGMDGVLHPPLYVQTLALWRNVFGDGDIVARSYSIAWNLIAIAFTFAAARLAMDRGIAVLAAAAIAFAPTQIYFAQEIRGYAMLGGLSTIAVWWMTRIECLGPTRQRVMVLIGLTLPLLLTHYFAFGVTIAIAVYGVARLHGHRAAALLSLVGAAAIYAVIWLPFAVQQIDDLGTGDQSWRVTRVDVARELQLTANAPFRLVSDRDVADEPMSVATSVLFVLPWLLVHRLRPMVPWALVLVCVVGSLLVLDVVRSTQLLVLTRYLAAASPVVFLLFAGCGAAMGRKAGYLCAASMSAWACVYLIAGTTIVRDVQSYGDVAKLIEQRGRPGEPVVAFNDAGDSFFGDAILLTCRHSPAYTPRPFLNLTSPATADLAKSIGPRAWVVTPSDRPPDAILPGAHAIDRRMVDFNLFVYYVELGVDAADAAARPSGP